MIIGVSIVDKHKRTGEPASGHVGTYYFEVDYPAGHEGQIALLAGVVRPEEHEAAARKLCGRLLSVEDIIREAGQVNVRCEVLNK